MPSQDYLSVIRETEEKAEAMIAAAQGASRLALEDARAEAARRLEAARAEAEALQQQTLREAVARSDEASQARIAEAGQEALRIRADAEPAMAEAVRAVAERIVK